LTLVGSRYCPVVPDGVGPSAVGPILCAGVTVYQGLKVTDTQPGEWVLVSGIGGLGHIAVQYAVAMGRRVAAVDVDDEKLALARKHGIGRAVCRGRVGGVGVQRRLGGLGCFVGGDTS